MQADWRRKIVTAVVGILISQAAGVAGAASTRDGIRNWYPTLRKPSFTPPSWVFGPVWTILYTMMGIAASTIWRRRSDASGSSRALSLFGAQLALNSFWSVAFFKRHSPLQGLIVIVPLWITILMTMLAFFPISSVAGALLIPYLAWTSFAAALNLRIWQLNRDDAK